MLSPKDAWQATLGQLQLQLNRATFDTWLKGSELLAYEDGEFAIRVRHAYAKDWLEQHLEPQIAQTLGDIFKRTVNVNFVVHVPARQQLATSATATGPLFETAAAQAKTPDATSEKTKPTPADAASESKTAEAKATKAAGSKIPAAEAPEAKEVKEIKTPATPAPKKAQVAEETSAAAITCPDYSEWDPRITDVRRSTTPSPNGKVTPLDRRYTFEAFITGPSNHFASAATQAVADAPGKKYNPLVIYGEVGLGKTHLLQALGQCCRAAGQQVLYITAEAFTNELVEAIRVHKTEELRARYRHVDVFLLDDIQFMAGKTSSEEEFYHTFNALFSQEKQIAVVSNQHPRKLTKLDDRIRSRLEGGLLADIQAPDFETRLAILQAKANAQGTPLPDPVATALAQHPVKNVRELEGLLTQVLARTTLTKQPLTVELVEQVLNKNSVQPRPSRASNIKQVLKATATYHQLSLDDLLSRRRTKQVVRARQIAMYLAREETDASLPQIGAALGGRNHSTVLYGYQKIANNVANDDALRREVNDIRRQLDLAAKN